MASRQVNTEDGRQERVGALILSILIIAFLYFWIPGARTRSQQYFSAHAPVPIRKQKIRPDLKATAEDEEKDTSEPSKHSSDDIRAIRAAAAEKRSRLNKTSGKGGEVKSHKYISKKDRSLVEQLAAENLGYRYMDQNAEMRAYN